MTAADRDFAPFFPGISDTDSLSDWDPPFPVDLSRVRRQDEAYWERYRTLPKAFVPLDVAQDLWGTRWGRLTAAAAHRCAGRVARLAGALRDRLAPVLSGLVVDSGAAGSAQRLDRRHGFRRLFHVLQLLHHRVRPAPREPVLPAGVEQRIQQVGLLRAIGYSPRRLRSLFLMEAGLLAAIGSLAGVIGALGYAWLIMFGLRTWWVGAVGTTLLELHPSWSAMESGVAGGAIAGLLTILYTLRAFRRASPRALLTGDVTEALKPRHRRAGAVPRRRRGACMRGRAPGCACGRRSHRRCRWLFRRRHTAARRGTLPVRISARSRAASVRSMAPARSRWYGSVCATRHFAAAEACCRPR